MPESHSDQTSVARSSEGFSRVVQAMPDIVLVMDRQGRVVDCNEHVDLIAPRAEMIGRPMNELLPSDLVDRETRAIEEALDSDQQVTFEYSLEVQGRSSWFEARLRSFDEDHVLQVSRNIDSEKAVQEERTRREQVVLLSEGRLSRAQAVAKVGSWELDIGTGELSWSDGIYELFEQDKERFASTYEAFLDAIHPDDREHVNAAYSGSLVDRSPYQIIHRLLMADGRIKWVEERCVTDFASDGTALVSLGTVRDITEEHLVGEELRQFKETLDQTLDCVFMFDAQSLQFTYVNQGAIEQLGYDQAELLQLHPYDIKPEIPEPKFRDMLAPLLACKQNQIKFETVHRHKDGHLVPVDVSLQYVESPKHEAHFVAVVRDITDRKKVEAELLTRVSDLQRYQTEMDLLSEMSSLLQHALSESEVHGIVEEYGRRLLPSFDVSIYSYMPQRKTLELKSSWGSSDGLETIASSDCWALRRSQTHRGNMGLLPRCAHGCQMPAGQQLCIPISVHNQASGVVSLSSTREMTDDARRDLERLGNAIADQLALTLSNIALRDSLRELATRDPLTGLFNRRHLEDVVDRELSGAMRRDSKLSVLMIDVDRFKEYNDTHGHQQADDALRGLGDLLTRAMRQEDIVCRYGGEEFVAILPNCSLESAVHRAGQVQKELARTTLGITLSIGAAECPTDGKIWGSVLRAADERMYAAKAAGRDCIRFELS